MGFAASCKYCKPSPLNQSLASLLGTLLKDLCSDIKPKQDSTRLYWGSTSWASCGLKLHARRSRVDMEVSKKRGPQNRS